MKLAMKPAVAPRLEAWNRASSSISTDEDDDEQQQQLSRRLSAPPTLKKASEEHDGSPRVPGWLVSLSPEQLFPRAFEKAPNEYDDIEHPEPKWLDAAGKELSGYTPREKGSAPRVRWSLPENDDAGAEPDWLTEASERLSTRESAEDVLAGGEAVQGIPVIGTPVHPEEPRPTAGNNPFSQPLDALYRFLDDIDVCSCRHAANHQKKAPPTFHKAS